MHTARVFGDPTRGVLLKTMTTQMIPMVRVAIIKYTNCVHMNPQCAHCIYIYISRCICSVHIHLQYAYTYGKITIFTLHMSIEVHRIVWLLEFSALFFPFSPQEVVCTVNTRPRSECEAVCSSVKHPPHLDTRFTHVTLQVRSSPI